MKTAALLILSLPVLGAATLKVVSPTSLDWTAAATSAGMPAKASGTIFVVLAPGAEPLSWGYVDSNGVQETATATLLGTARDNGAASGGPRPIRVEVSLKSASLPGQGYLIGRPKAGEPLAIPLKINTPEKAAELIRADSARRVDKVMQGGILGALAMVGLATLLVIQKLGFKALNRPMGAASWEFGSWATNTTVVASILTAVIGFPAAGWMKFEWGRNYGLIAASAAFLVAIAPSLYNLTRVPKVDRGGALLYSGRVWIFLIMSFLTAWGATSQWLVAWLAVGELEAKSLISGVLIKGVHVLLTSFAMALIWYVVRSIPATVEAQTKEDTSGTEPRVSSSPTTHPHQTYVRLL